MMAWFTVLALGGVLEIMVDPAILVALNPVHALQFLWQNGWVAFSWAWVPSCWR